MVNLPEIVPEPQKKKQPPKPNSLELELYLNRINIRGADREACLEMANVLCGSLGLRPIEDSKLSMWVAYDSGNAERVYADIFFDSGKCRCSGRIRARRRRPENSF